MADLGWYPDPTTRHQHRFFDGSVWTDHVADDGVRGIDPIGAPPATAAANTSVPSARADVETPTVESMLRRSRRDASLDSLGGVSNGSAPMAAGWYSDPSRAHHLRFFDGYGWTEYVTDGDGYRVDPL